mmetsp:Transcript_89108/g.231133  ORF Transcript_89108/g.231133 Transcript_89108/m.231133 type:complete len:371 (-) Transcript_89108:2356-3468(-)
MKSGGCCNSRERNIKSFKRSTRSLAVIFNEFGPVAVASLASFRAWVSGVPTNMFDTTVRFEIEENNVFINSTRDSGATKQYNKQRPFNPQSATKIDKPATARTKARHSFSLTSATQAAPLSPLASLRNRTTSHTIPHRWLISRSAISAFAASFVGGPFASSSDPAMSSKRCNKAFERSELADPDTVEGSEAAADNAKPKAARASSPGHLRPMATKRSMQSSQPSPPHAASWPKSRHDEWTNSRAEVPSSVSLVSPRPPVTDFEKSYNRSRNACLVMVVPPAEVSSTSQTRARCSLSLRKPSHVAARTAASSSAPGTINPKTFWHKFWLLVPQTSERRSSQIAKAEPARLAVPCGAPSSASSASTQRRDPP